MIINKFKLTNFFLHHSASLDTETEAAYMMTNYKSYNWKLSMLQFPEMTTIKKWRPAKNRAHTLSRVIFCSK